MGASVPYGGLFLALGSELQPPHCGCEAVVQCTYTPLVHNFFMSSFSPSYSRAVPSASVHPSVTYMGKHGANTCILSQTLCIPSLILCAIIVIPGSCI